MNSELETLKKRLFEDNKAKNVKFFPGSRSDIISSDIAKEMNKAFAAALSSEVDTVVA